MHIVCISLCVPIIHTHMSPCVCVKKQSDQTRLILRPVHQAHRWRKLTIGGGGGGGCTGSASMFAICIMFGF